MRSTRTPLRALAAATLLTLTACGGGNGGDDAGSGGGGGDAEAPRIAAVFSGVTTDADYTFLGLEALEAAEADFGAETTSGERRRPRRRAGAAGGTADGYTVVWTHGSQFYDATVAVAQESPDVIFIAEQDTEPADVPDNVWVLDRNFHLASTPWACWPRRSARAGRSPTSAASPCCSPTGGARGRAGAGRQRLHRHAEPGVDR